MKITDKELINALWKQMLINMSKKCITTYAGGNHGLDELNSTSFIAASEVTKYSFNCDRLKRKQLYSRLKKLTADYDCIKQHINAYYYIDSIDAKIAFSMCHKFYELKGVPIGYDKKLNKIRTIRIDNYDDIVKECQDHLIENYYDQKNTL